VVTYATAFVLSSIFLGGYSDYAHLIEDAAYTRDPIDNIAASLLDVIMLGTLPILTVLGLSAFLIERKTHSSKSYSLLFSVLGILALPWGGLHLFTAIGDYDGATRLAVAQGASDPNHALLIIYGGYGLGVGVLWIAMGIILLIMSRKLV